MFNEINESGQLSQLLQRRLNMLGSSPAPSLMPEVAPCLTLENDRPEWGFLKNERRCSTVVVIGASAGNYSVAQFYLPSNANSIAVIDRIENLGTSDTEVARLVGIGGSIGGWAAAGRGVRDTRWNGQGTSVFFEAVQGPVLPTRFPALNILNQGVRSMEEPLIIAPGGAFGIYPTGINQSLVVNVYWYERPALPGELV